jgi:outer membrane protein
MKKLISIFAIIAIHFTALDLFAVGLDEAVRSALQKNEGIGQSRLQLQESEEYVRQIRGNIFPNLSLKGSSLKQPKLSDPVAAAFFPEEQTTTNLNLTQPLFRGL